MIWNLEQVKHEIHVFAEHAREILGNVDGVKELEECPVEISKRMTRTKGCFEYETERANGKVVRIKPLKIKISQHLLDNYHDADIIDTIRHECVHHIVDLYTKGKSKGHDKTFKQFCQMLGVSDETYFTAKPKKDGIATPVKRLEVRYIGKCTCCGKEFPRKIMKRDTIWQWIYNSSCQCGGNLHVQDLKEEIVYIPNRYKNLDNKISLTEYKKGEVSTEKEMTVEDYIEDLSKLKASKYIELSESSDFDSEFDRLWWSALMTYDTDKDYMSSLELKSLKIWLNESQKFTIEFRGTSI